MARSSAWRSPFLSPPFVAVPFQLFQLRRHGGGRGGFFFFLREHFTSSPPCIARGGKEGKRGKKGNPETHRGLLPGWFWSSVVLWVCGRMNRCKGHHILRLPPPSPCGTQKQVPASIRSSPSRQQKERAKKKRKEKKKKKTSPGSLHQRCHGFGNFLGLLLSETMQEKPSPTRNRNPRLFAHTSLAASLFGQVHARV